MDNGELSLLRFKSPEERDQFLDRLRMLLGLSKPDCVKPLVEEVIRLSDEDRKRLKKGFVRPEPPQVM